MVEWCCRGGINLFGARDISDCTFGQQNNNLIEKHWLRKWQIATFNWQQWRGKGYLQGCDGPGEKQIPWQPQWVTVAKLGGVIGDSDGQTETTKQRQATAIITGGSNGLRANVMGGKCNGRMRQANVADKCNRQMQQQGRQQRATARATGIGLETGNIKGDNKVDGWGQLRQVM